MNEWIEKVLAVRKTRSKQNYISWEKLFHSSTINVFYHHHHTAFERRERCFPRSYDTVLYINWKKQFCGTGIECKWKRFASVPKCFWFQKRCQVAHIWSERICAQCVQRRQANRHTLYTKLAKNDAVPRGYFPWIGDAIPFKCRCAKVIYIVWISKCCEIKVLIWMQAFVR